MGVMISFIRIDRKNNRIDIFGFSKKEIEKINKLNVSLEEKIKMAKQLIKSI